MRRAQAEQNRGGSMSCRRLAQALWSTSPEGFPQ
jgi:hypothetical protein